MNSRSDTVGEIKPDYSAKTIHNEAQRRKMNRGSVTFGTI